MEETWRTEIVNLFIVFAQLYGFFKQLQVATGNLINAQIFIGMTDYLYDVDMIKYDFIIFLRWALRATRRGEGDTNVITFEDLKKKTI